MKAVTGPRGVVDPAFWRDRRVLLTGHTGFKGAWLSLWLQSLGAHLTGISLAEPPSKPSLYELARVEEGMTSSVVCDIRDSQALTRAVLDACPEIVIHMAAQPLVRRSFAAPVETYETNVIGTVNLLEALRACSSVRAAVVVTSDKCYLPSHPHRESSSGHREDDPLGGHDPYSSSKAAAELVVLAYGNSFFEDLSGLQLASARAGNVIGGGDWGAERLIPDLFRAVARGETLRLRNPQAVRPWQHVLSPLSGYLVLAQGLFASAEYARAWNFGPAEADTRSVEWVVQQMSELWSGGVPWEVDQGDHPRETASLRLNSSRARELLGWAPTMSLEEGLALTVDWFQAHREGADMRAITLEQIRQTSASQAR